MRSLRCYVEGYAQQRGAARRQVRHGVERYGSGAEEKRCLPPC